MKYENLSPSLPGYFDGAKVAFSDYERHTSVFSLRLLLKENPCLSWQ